jgi:pimeloyl-ACP methyl ester carboxylesterase
MRRSATAARALSMLLVVGCVGWSTPVPLLAATPSVKRAQLDDFFESGGVEIHFTDRGDGVPVVLIHGFMGSYEGSWEAPGIIPALLEAGYRVIAYDMRGHGESDKPHDPGQYGMEMVEDAVRLLDHLGLERAHVVGYSMGGLVTNKLRETYPERLLTATLGGAGWTDASFFDPEVADGIERGDLSGLARILQPVGAPVLSEETIRQQSAFLLANRDVLALAAAWRGGIPPVSEESLRSNEVPTLALIGGLDPLKVTVDRLSGVMEGLEVVVIEETNHFTAFRNPMFVESLMAFLGRHRGIGAN